jgi:hypothetical protein
MPPIIQPVKTGRADFRNAEDIRHQQIRDGEAPAFRPGSIPE